MNEPLASVVAMSMTSFTKTSITKTPAEQLAEQLDNIGYNPDFTKEQLQFAKDNGLVIVYGASDDLMEFDGAIREEVGALEGTVALIDAHGVITEDRDEPAGPHKSIYAFWCSDEPDADGFTWSYKTDIPHSTFRMMDGEEKYCRGIVFALTDVKRVEPEPQCVPVNIVVCGSLDDVLDSLDLDAAEERASQVAERGPVVEPGADDNDCGDACKI